MKIENSIDEEERPYIKSYCNTVILWGLFLRQKVEYK